MPPGLNPRQSAGVTAPHRDGGIEGRGITVSLLGAVPPKSVIDTSTDILGGCGGGQGEGRGGYRDGRTGG